MGNGLPGQVGYFSSKPCLVDFRDCDPYKHSSSVDIASPLQFLTLLLPSCSNICLSISLVISRSITLLLKVWSLDLQHQPHLGTCQRCTFLDSTPHLLNQRLWEEDLDIYILTSLPRGFLCTFKFKNLWSRRKEK